MYDAWQAEHMRVALNSGDLAWGLNLSPALLSLGLEQRFRQAAADKVTLCLFP